MQTSPLNRFVYALRRALRPLYRTRAFVRLTEAYFERALPLLRRWKPLFGSTAVLALTYRCPCTCAHCAVGTNRKDADDELRPDEVRALIDEFARLGAEEIHFFGGEPLLVPELPDYVRQAKARGLKLTLDTNGWLLDEAAARRLKEAGLDRIRVSLDSAEAAEHDRLRGLSGLHARAVEGIRHCARAGLECEVSACVSRISLRDGTLDGVLALARSLGVRVRVLSAIRGGRWAEREDVALTREDAELFRRHLRADAVHWETELVCGPETPFLCGAVLRNHFSVTAYGDVLPCAYLPVSFGNVRREPLLDAVRRVWASDLVRRHRAHYDCPLNAPDFGPRPCGPRPVPAERP
ncbi:MAG: radical SAM protein [Elusimicrobiota bacterium]